MRTKVRTLAAAVALSLATGSAMALPQVVFVPAGPYAVTAGGSLSVGVRIADLGGEIVSAYDLDVLFDPAVLDPVVVSFTGLPLLGGADALADVVFPGFSGIPGTLSVAALSLLADADLAALQAPEGGSFELFSIGFSVLADSPATEVVFGPFDATAGKDVKGFNNTPIIPNQPVPEPGTLALLALGLAGLAGARRSLPV